MFFFFFDFVKRTAIQEEESFAFYSTMSMCLGIFNDVSRFVVYGQITHLNNYLESPCLL